MPFTVVLDDEFADQLAETDPGDMPRLPLMDALRQGSRLMAGGRGGDEPDSLGTLLGRQSDVAVAAD
jgi:hypothetical protein